MSVTEIRKFHVSVTIPDEIWERYRDTQPWDFAIQEATKGHIESGSEGIDQIEWADFWFKENAQKCEAKLNAVIEQFQTKLIEDKERERLEDEDV